MIEAGAESEQIANRAAIAAPWLPVLAPAAMLSLLLAALAEHLVVSDTWVGLVSGREVWHHGIPSVEHLTSLAAGREWIDQQWLAQLFMYSVEKLGGVGVVVGVCAAAVVAGFILCAAVARGRGATPGSLLIFFLAAFLSGPWGVQARTQSLALPLFGLVVWLTCTDRDASRRRTLCLIPVLCLWANVHGSVLLGVAIVIGYGAVVLSRGSRRGLIYVVAAPACIFASPYRFRLVHYYSRMTLHPPFGREIVEWQRTTPSKATFVFFVLAAVAALLVIVKSDAVDRFDLVLLLITFGFGLNAVRLTFWLGLAALAVLPALASAGKPAIEFRGPAAGMVAGAFALVLAGTLVSIPSRAVPPALWRPDQLSAVRHLPPGQKVFADLDVADWLLWDVPSLRGRIPFDARPELLTRTDFQNVAVRASAFRPGWRHVLATYRLVVLEPERSIEQMSRGGWRRVGSAPKFVVLARGR